MKTHPIRPNPRILSACACSNCNTARVTQPVRASVINTLALFQSREASMRYKNLAVLTALALAALTHFSALAQTCPTNVPHITGTWTVLPYQMPINPISANLLPSGKVLIVAGSENDASNNSEGAESYRAAVRDPSGTNESSISVQHLTYDVFCSGTAALSDGRWLTVARTSH